MIRQFLIEKKIYIGSGAGIFLLLWWLLDSMIGGAILTHLIGAGSVMLDDMYKERVDMRDYIAIALVPTFIYIIGVITT